MCETICMAKLCKTQNLTGSLRAFKTHNHLKQPILLPFSCCVLCPGSSRLGPGEGAASRHFAHPQLGDIAADLINRCLPPHDVELFGARAGCEESLRSDQTPSLWISRFPIRQVLDVVCQKSWGIAGSHSTSERECRRCCSPDDIQLIALLEALLHACTLSGSSRPTVIMSKVQLKKCRVTSTGHRIRVPNTSSCPECRRPGEGWAWGV